MSLLSLTALGSALIGAGIVHLFNISRLLTERQWKAKDCLRASFTEDITAIKESHPSNIGKTYDILTSSYSMHESAYDAFIREGNFIQNFSLRKRWLQYRGEYPKHPELSEEDLRYRLSHFLATSLEEERIKKAEALSLIEKLIR